jgi:hypothetical protein
MQLNNTSLKLRHPELGTTTGHRPRALHDQRRFHLRPIACAGGSTDDFKGNSAAKL